MGETSEIYKRMNDTDQKLNCIDGKLTVLIDQNSRLFRFLNIVGIFMCVLIFFLVGLLGYGAVGERGLFASRTAASSLVTSAVGGSK